VSRKHVKETHPDGRQCDDAFGTCYICHLYVCAVCHGCEGSLPTDCPGVRMTPEQEEGVYQDGRDFVGGVWTTGEAQTRYLKQARHLRALTREMLQVNVLQASPGSNTDDGRPEDQIQPGI
jgi:hypothetical protein